MTETVFRGPAYSAGSLFDGRVEGASDGPGIEYQANCFPDVRWFPTRKDGIGPGRVPCILNSPFAVVVDTLPSTTSNTVFAAAQAASNGVPLTNATVAPGGSAQNVPSMAPVPLVPFQKGVSSLVNVLAVDFGFTTGNITAGSATVANVSDPTIFQLGQWICIGGGGNSAKTASLMTQVVGIGTTSITVSPAPLGTLTAAPIGSTNNPAGPYSQPGTSGSPTGVDPYLTAGLARILNPNEGIARNITVTANAGATGGAVVIRGFDVFGNPMSESITAAAASTVAGKKAFKYFLSATPGFTDAGHTYSIGDGNVVGFNLRSLFWEYTNVFYAGTFATTSAQCLYVAADTTNPATATTGDVRGTVSLSGGSAPFNSAPDGT